MAMAELFLVKKELSDLVCCPTRMKKRDPVRSSLLVNEHELVWAFSGYGILNFHHAVQTLQPAGLQARTRQ